MAGGERLNPQEREKRRKAALIVRAAHLGHEQWRKPTREVTRGNATPQRFEPLDLQNKKDEVTFWALRMAGEHEKHEGGNPSLINHRIRKRENPEVDISRVDLHYTPQSVQEEAKTLAQIALQAVENQLRQIPSPTLTQLEKDIEKTQQALQENRPQQHNWVTETVRQINNQQPRRYSDQATQIAFVHAAVQTKIEDLEGYADAAFKKRPLLSIIDLAKKIQTNPELRNTLPVISRNDLLVDPDFVATDQNMFEELMKALTRGFRGVPEYIPDKPYDYRNPDDPDNSQCFWLPENLYEIWVKARRPTKILISKKAYEDFVSGSLPLNQIPDVTSIIDDDIPPWLIKDHWGRAGIRIRKPHEELSGAKTKTMDPDIFDYLKNSDYGNIRYLGDIPLDKYEKEIIVDKKAGILWNGYNWRGMVLKDGNWIGRNVGAVDVFAICAQIDESGQFLAKYLEADIVDDGRRGSLGETIEDPKEDPLKAAKRTMLEEAGSKRGHLQHMKFLEAYTHKYGGDNRNTLITGRKNLSAFACLIDQELLAEMERGMTTNDPGEIGALNFRIASTANEQNLKKLFGIQPVAARAVFAIVLKELAQYGLGINKNGYIGILQDLSPVRRKG